MQSAPTSILDRDRPRPVTVTPNDTSDLVLPIILLVVIVLFLIWMIVLLILSGFSSSTTDNPVATDSRTNNPTTGVCPPGQCATNILSGFKTCPQDSGDTIGYNPTQEVCNDAFFCTNPLTPFAVLSDGSTNIDGVCETSVQCQCVSTPQCASYVTSIFNTRNGNPYVSFSGQRISFPQSSSYVDNNGAVVQSPPLQYSNPATTFCTAPLSWLPFANPGCNFVNPLEANSMDYQDLLVCMGLPNSCNGALGNPCLTGTLALITDNPESLNQTNIDVSQFGCVNGTPCPCGLVSVYDTNYGGIVCMDLPLALIFTTTSPLPPGEAGFAYNTTISASGGTLPYRFSSTNLPNNLTLTTANNVAQITGTPTVTGTFQVNITVIDDTGASTLQTFTLRIN